MRYFLFIYIIVSSLLISGCASPIAPQPTGSLEVYVQETFVSGVNPNHAPPGWNPRSEPKPASLPLVIKRLPDMKVVAELRSDANGFARQELAVGKYQVELKDARAPRSSDSVEVQLLDSQVQRVTIDVTILGS